MATARLYCWIDVSIGVVHVRVHRNVLLSLTWGLDIITNYTRTTFTQQQNAAFQNSRIWCRR